LRAAPAARFTRAAEAPAQTTDGHLLALAGAHSARLATFDEEIPGGVVIA
jgi:hypothetical protein